MNFIHACKFHHFSITFNKYVSQIRARRPCFLFPFHTRCLSLTNHRPRPCVHQRKERRTHHSKPNTNHPSSGRSRNENVSLFAPGPWRRSKLARILISAETTLITRWPIRTVRVWGTRDVMICVWCVEVFTKRISITCVRMGGNFYRI